MSTSVNDIITRAMRLTGITGASQIPDAQDTNDAFNSLNMMLEQWSLEELMCYRYTANQFSTAASTSAYTIGPGGTWVTGGRPLQVSNAFIRVSTTDFPIEIIGNDLYQQIGNKSTVGRPYFLYYQPEVTLGRIYLYPTPDAVYTISISQLLPFTAFTGIAQAVTLPPGYLKALIWNLAVELAPEYGKQVDPVIFKKSQEFKANIKRKNNTKPILHLESALLGRAGCSFDINSGGF